MNKSNRLDVNKKKDLIGSLQDNMDDKAKMRHSRIRDNLEMKMKINNEYAASKIWAHTRKEQKSCDMIAELHPGN